MNAQAIIQEIREGKLYPIYLLHGEEPFFVDEVAHVLENELIDESLADFNKTILYGKDADAEQIVEASRRMPMMSANQLVMLKEAQHFKAWDQLLVYLENPQPTTVLTLCFKGKKMDGRSKTIKAIKKANGLVFESKKMYDNQVEGWIASLVSQKNKQIEHQAKALLFEYLGNDLSKIKNEVNKLILSKTSDSPISLSDIERNIGISKDYNVFEFQKAIGNKDVAKAMSIAKYFENNPKAGPLVLVIGTVFSFFKKLLIFHKTRAKDKYELAKSLGVSPFFISDYQRAARNFSFQEVKDAIELLYQYDLRSKGVENTTPEAELIKELTFKLTA